MGPKKKRCAPPQPPGILRKYLTETFSDTPYQSDLLNGHVLLIYINAQRSPTKTEKELSSQYPDLHLTAKASLYSKIVCLVRNSLNKYQDLRVKTTLQHFKDVCNQKFITTPETSIPTQDNETVVNVSEPMCTDSNVTTITKAATLPSQPHLVFTQTPVTPTKSTSTSILSPRKTRSIRKYNSNYCKKLRDDLKRSQNMVVKMKQDKRCMKYRRPRNRKNTKQMATRRLAIIDTLKEQLQTVNGDDCHTQLKTLQRKHNRLKLKNKQRKKSDSDRDKLLNELEIAHDTICTLSKQIKDNNETISDLEYRVKVNDENEGESFVSKEGNRYSNKMRLLAYDSITSQVPTNSTEDLLTKFFKRCGLSIKDIPKRSTVELMARELYVLSQLQAGDVLYTQNDLTIGFDATTQDGTHVNAIHITTETNCVVLTIDELAGGTASDYAEHIIQTIDNIAGLYAQFKNIDYIDCRKTIISNISNSITDRCASNHACISIVNEAWKKSLTELNCHLHPLDTIASSCRSALVKVDGKSANLFGFECSASTIVIQMNKLRFKDAKGDPKGFVISLEKQGLRRGIIPRYRGNRIHVLFHICGIYTCYHSKFLNILSTGTDLGSLRKALKREFETETARTQMHVLGILGKLLTGPWMVQFYTSADNEINHIEGIQVVKNVVNTVKKYCDDPLAIFSSPVDFFGNTLHLDADPVLCKLFEPPINEGHFSTCMTACLNIIVTVLERQYAKYFALDVNELLIHETRTARSHNMDSEELMGMFSAAKAKSPNATVCYLASKIIAQKNKTVDYIDQLESKVQNQAIKMAITQGRKVRDKKRLAMKELRKEMLKRQLLKQQQRVTKDLKKLEKTIKSCTFDELLIQYPDITDERKETLSLILTGKASGRYICHTYVENNVEVIYNGKLESYKATKAGTKKEYVVAYWCEGESYADAEDYRLTIHQIAADFLCGDLTVGSYCA